MRVFIVGAAGLLGHTLLRRWYGRPGWDVSAADISPAGLKVERLDALEPGAVKAAVQRLKPDIVIFPASNPHVDFCETNPQETRRLNVEATLSAAQASISLGCKFVFFSSDYVFDGIRGDYREEALPFPLNEYGKQKLEVEKALAAYGEKALTVRLSGLFGWELKPRNYVLQVLSRLRSGGEVTAPGDIEYYPTFAEGFADGLSVLLEKNASGLIHLAGSERLTRASFSRLIAEVFGLDASLIVPPPQGFPPPRAPRPKRSFLDSSKAKTLFGASVGDSRRGLERMRATEAEWSAYAAGIR
ncbi:MAG: SDR family oxidoreductase [Elusimicrobiota bacterium]